MKPEIMDYKCPVCKSNVIYDGYYYACENYPDCGAVIPSYAGVSGADAFFSVLSTPVIEDDLRETRTDHYFYFSEKANITRKIITPLQNNMPFIKRVSSVHPYKTVFGRPAVLDVKCLCGGNIKSYANEWKCLNCDKSLSKHILNNMRLSENEALELFTKGYTPWAKGDKFNRHNQYYQRAAYKKTYFEFKTVKGIGICPLCGGIVAEADSEYIYKQRFYGCQNCHNFQIKPYLDFDIAISLQDAQKLLCMRHLYKSISFSEFDFITACEIYLDENNNYKTKIDYKTGKCASCFHLNEFDYCKIHNVEITQKYIFGCESFHEKKADVISGLNADEMSNKEYFDTANAKLDLLDDIFFDM